MDLATRLRVFVALAVCLFVTQILFAQTSTAKGPFATVSGRVTIKGKPAVGLTIALRRNQMNTTPDVVTRGSTDSNGEYRVTNVPAGSYDVVPVAPAFVISDQGSPRGKRIFVGEGENVEGIDIALVRGGVVTGRVTDAEGRPVVQQQVNLYRADAWEQRGPNQQVFPTAGGGFTDDRGIYRAFGLMAGRYKVAVGRSDDTFSGAQPPGRATYKRVFHPNTSDPAQATVVEVTEGSEATGIDISLEKPVETYFVSGRIVDADKGQPIGGLRLALERVGAGAQTYASFAQANTQGEFSFDGVIPGKYVVSQISQAGNEQLLQSPSIEVTEENVLGVVVRATKGASVSGVIALENENPQAMAKLRQVDVRGYVTPPSGMGGRSSTAKVTPDGEFQMGGLPAGIFAVFLSPGNTLPGHIKNFNVLRLERDGVPQPGNRFEVKDGETVTGVRLVVTYGDSTLRGSVLIENGKLPPDSTFHARLMTSSNPTGFTGITQIDARGHFIIEGVPAGVYDLIVNVTSATDPRARRMVKQQVTLTSGTTTDVTVTINASDPKSP